MSADVVVCETPAACTSPRGAAKMGTDNTRVMNRPGDCCKDAAAIPSAAQWRSESGAGIGISPIT